MAMTHWAQDVDVWGLVAEQLLFLSSEEGRVFARSVGLFDMALGTTDEEHLLATRRMSLLTVLLKLLTMNKRLDLDLPAAETVVRLLPLAPSVSYAWKPLQRVLARYLCESDCGKRAVRHLSKETFDPEDVEDVDDACSYHYSRPGTVGKTQEGDIAHMYVAEHEDYGIEGSVNTFIFKRKDGLFVYAHANESSGDLWHETLACADNVALFWNSCLSNAARHLLWTVLKPYL
jgi:hypothetical protein